MKQIDLDFNERTRNRQKLNGWWLLLLGLIVTAGLIAYFNKLESTHQRIKIALAMQSDKQRTVFLNGNTNTKELEPEFKRAALTIEQLAFPWESLFKTLEASIDENVVLIAVQPDVATGMVTINVEARDWTAMLDYTKRLEGDVFFKDVQLVSHQTQLTDSQRPVRFVLVCKMRS